MNMEKFSDLLRAMDSHPLISPLSKGEVVEIETHYRPLFSSYPEGSTSEEILTDGQIEVLEKEVRLRCRTRPAAGYEVDERVAVSGATYIILAREEVVRVNDLLREKPARIWLSPDADLEAAIEAILSAIASMIYGDRADTAFLPALEDPEKAREWIFTHFRVEKDPADPKDGVLIDRDPEKKRLGWAGWTLIRAPEARGGFIGAVYNGPIKLLIKKHGFEALFGGPARSGIMEEGKNGRQTVY